MEECDQKFWIIFDQFGIFISCWATYFLEVSVRVLLKVATKGFIRGKKNSENVEECDQKVWNIFDQFDITIPFLARYFLEVGVRVLFKGATKGPIRGKKDSENVDFSVVFL